LSSIEITFQTAAGGLYEGTLVNLPTFDYIILLYGNTNLPLRLSINGKGDEQIAVDSEDRGEGISFKEGSR